MTKKPAPDAPKPDAENPAAAAGTNAAAAKPDDQTQDPPADTAAANPQPPAMGNDSAVSEAGVGAQASAPVTEVQSHSADVADILRGPEGVVILVKGPAKGRWRIGRHFGPETVEIPASELTVAQIDALTADPELMVKSMP
jgi:hypothetical protein